MFNNVKNCILFLLNPLTPRSEQSWKMPRYMSGTLCQVYVHDIQVFVFVGFSSLVLDSTHSCLFASCTNDNIYKYSCTALGQEPLCIFYGHLNSTFYVKAALSPDDQYLISGSSDSNAYIWRVTDDTAAPILMTGHLGEVTSVAWCPSDQGKVGIKAVDKDYSYCELSI